MKIKNVFILILLILISINCSAEYKLKVVDTFKPLGAKEKLSFITFGQEESPYYLAIVFRDTGDNYLDKITEIGPVNYNPKMISDSTKLVYSVEDKIDRRKSNAYLIDGKNGETYFIGKVFPAFYDISDNGRYLCYEIDSKRKYIELYKGERSIPGIMWKDLETGETREYDFSNTFLKDEWGAGAFIRYIADRDVFSFNFFIESESFSKGFINASGGDYKEYKDVIAVGGINSKDIYLRKNPDIRGEFVTIGHNHRLYVRREGVDIIGKTKDKVKIGSHHDYWYKIRTSSMFEGWVYGAYINIKK